MFLQVGRASGYPTNSVSSLKGTHRTDTAREDHCLSLLFPHQSPDCRGKDIAALCQLSQLWHQCPVWYNSDAL